VHRCTIKMPGTGARRQAARPGHLHARPSRPPPSSSSCAIRRVDVAMGLPLPSCWLLTRSPRTPALVPLSARTAAVWPPPLGISPPCFPDKRKRHGLSAACPSCGAGATPRSLMPLLPLCPLRPSPLHAHTRRRPCARHSSQNAPALTYKRASSTSCLHHTSLAKRLHRR
jgi:hypothetical protein